MCEDILFDLDSRDLRNMMNDWHPDEDLVKRQRFLKEVHLFTKESKVPVMLTEEYIGSGFIDRGVLAPTNNHNQPRTTAGDHYRQHTTAAGPPSGSND